MEIDFHHGVVYVLSRLAGFSKEEADIVASSSQFVDDAIWGLPIFFKTGEIYKPMSSAHKTLDYRNFVELANRLSWVSFHFLPGNCEVASGMENGFDFESRLVCKPNSFLAKDMVEECIRNRGEANALFRLGISLHVYADTWAHQGFSGIQSNLNKVGYVNDEVVSANLKQKVKNFFSDIYDSAVGTIVENVLPLGHGAVLSYPDRPYLKWKYFNSNGKLVERDNTEIFMEAVKNVYEVLCQFRNGDIEVSGVYAPLTDDSLNKIKELMTKTIDSDPIKRLNVWLSKIEEDHFGFGSEKAKYVICGPDSWEYAAFGRELQDDKFKYDFKNAFLESNWMQFHDALIDHHYYLTRVIFPKYKFCIS